eukprot:TRINITY_DN18504_c0_g1_i1.p1 TRINITY_DN18504_c0_g1~~TRINITY_DN18504_c0_g1_i1.p1  ORF type:complete len:880 (+),score=175.91 TRINITY_DN18504_c0_g1_i1:60-2699(+)
MLDPDSDWYSTPQGPPQPPEGIYELLEPPGLKRPCDPDMLKLVMSYYGGSITDGLFEGHGHGKYNVGYSYEGDYNGCLFNGDGVIKWSDGQQYKGETQENTLTGKGVYNYSSGDTYEGEVLNGIRHGKGTYRRKATGEKYSGDWKQGKKHGFGILNYCSQSYYEGLFDTNKKTGKGKQLYKSGSTYEGDWLDDQRHGTGTMIWVRNGVVTEQYSGEWKNGNMDGIGTHWLYNKTSTDSSQNYYKGSFKSNTRHGHGLFCYSDGSRYEGEWKDNIKHGQGMYLLHSGECYVGEFIDDKPAHPIQPSEQQSICRYVPLHIDDLLIAETDKKKTSNQIQCLISRHYWDLRRLYNHYSGVGGVGAERGRKDHLTAMSMLQFWRLAKDTNLVSADGSLTIADLDRVFFHFHSEPHARVPIHLDPIPPPRLSSGLTNGSYNRIQNTCSIESVATPTTKKLEEKSTNLNSPSHTEVNLGLNPLAVSEPNQGSALNMRRKSKVEGSVVSQQGNRAQRMSVVQQGMRRASGTSSKGGKKRDRVNSSHQSTQHQPGQWSHSTKDIHVSDAYLYFREFTEAIVRIANAKYRMHPSLSLPDKLTLCLQSDIKTTTESNFLSESDKVADVIAKHSDSLRMLFNMYSKRSYQGLDVYQKRLHNDTVVTVRQFITLLKEANLLKGKLSMQNVLQLFEVSAPLLAVPSIEQTGSDAAETIVPQHNFGASGRISVSTSVFQSTLKSERKPRARSRESVEFRDQFEATRNSTSGSAEAAGNSDPQSRTPSPIMPIGELVSASRRSSVAVGRIVPEEEEAEERRRARKSALSALVCGPNNFNVTYSITVDQDLVFEEFVEALVKVSTLRSDDNKSRADAFEDLVTNHLCAAGIGVPAL